MWRGVKGGSCNGLWGEGWWWFVWLMGELYCLQPSQTRRGGCGWGGSLLGDSVTGNAQHGCSCQTVAETTRSRAARRMQYVQTRCPGAVYMGHPAQWHCVSMVPAWYGHDNLQAGWCANKRSVHVVT
ncbi:hypothetical protein BDZ91DRAFT_836225 [Kalaharituber pfeilii]|nr:hypothetical protein BDZ91DRAFT_836225 [Kalaharituber pfeilii]